MRSNREQKAKVREQLRGFDKGSHAKSLVNGILRSCGDETEIPGRITRANVVVAAVREIGVTSFFAAEYGKTFLDPDTAVETRERLIAHYESEHGLVKRQAAKMADCIVFAAAKRGDDGAVERLSKLCSESLATGIPFTVVADVVYYNSADVAPEKFARRCVETSIKQNKPLSISEVNLSERLSEVVSR